MMRPPCSFGDLGWQSIDTIPENRRVLVLRADRITIGWLDRQLNGKTFCFIEGVTQSKIQDYWSNIPTQLKDSPYWKQSQK